jgi:hypothetical protein
MHIRKTNLLLQDLLVLGQLIIALAEPLRAMGKCTIPCEMHVLFFIPTSANKQEHNV